MALTHRRAARQSRDRAEAHDSVDHSLAPRPNGRQAPGRLRCHARRPLLLDNRSQPGAKRKRKLPEQQKNQGSTIPGIRSDLYSKSLVQAPAAFPSPRPHKEERRSAGPPRVRTNQIGSCYLSSAFMSPLGRNCCVGLFRSRRSRAAIAGIIIAE